MPVGPLRRELQIAAVLLVIGTLGSVWQWGWGGAAGFLLGALASWWNFRKLKQFTGVLGTEYSAGMPGLLAWTLFRFLLLVVGAFVILKFTKISLRAACFGLFVSTAAVVLEAIFPTAYER